MIGMSMNAKTDPGLRLIQLPACLLITAVYVAVNWSMESEFKVDARALVVVMLVLSLPTTVFAWFLPRLLDGVSRLGLLPKVFFPSREALISLAATTLAGVVLSELVMSLFKGGWHIALLAWMAPALIVFLVSAQRKTGNRS